jgi:mono/diheme cytochrome c family protein
MRHVQVARLTWALTGLFAVGAIVFAVTRPAEEPGARDREAGAAAFAAHCAHCHGPREFAYWASLQPEPEERRAWMDRLLRHHHPPPEASRPLIVEHIERVLAEGG